MWTIMLVSSCNRLHHSWIYRSLALLCDMIVPKIYLAIKDGFYIQDKAISMGITLMFIVMCFLLFENFRRTEFQERLLDQLAFDFNLQEDQAKILDRLPDGVIIAD